MSCRVFDRPRAFLVLAALLLALAPCAPPSGETQPGKKPGGGGSESGSPPASEPSREPPGGQGGKAGSQMGPTEPAKDASAPRDAVEAEVDAAPASPPEPPVSPACGVDPQRMFADVRHLASGELRGRKPGDPGNERALEFAEKSFQAAGLAPGGDDGTYRQAFEYRDGASTDNVLGKIVGEDPELTDEVVIVAAHIDHLGVNRDGAINYGADDNASGTAMVMELARLFGLCGVRPKRTMLFIAFNAEEMGLIGSRAYVEDPIFPLEDTIAVYNFDMVGAGDGSGAMVFGGNDARNRWMTDLLRATAEAAGLEHEIQVVPQKLASDHAPFVQRGVPSLFNFSRPDPHPGYHTPADDIDNVRLSSLRVIGELYWATLQPLARGEEEAFLRRSFSGQEGEGAGEDEGDALQSAAIAGVGVCGLALPLAEGAEPARP